MDYNDLLNDIKKLEGLNLSSIRPGANIVVEKVDIEHGKILIRNSYGKLFSRPLIEFRNIWENLNSKPAVRVEEALHGSGSSRNQPETVLANLPYIEWLKISNKKHIAYIAKDTHPFGTIRKMQSFEASKICDKCCGSDEEKFTVMISSDQFFNDISSFSIRYGVSPIAISVNEYKFSLEKLNLYIVNSNEKEVPVGVYVSMSLKQNQHRDKSIILDGKRFFIDTIGYLKLLIEDLNFI